MSRTNLPVRESLPDADARTRVRIARAVAQVSGCDNCLSAHTYLGVRARRGSSAGAKANAAVAFAASSAPQRGSASVAELQAVTSAGCTDAQLVETVGCVVELS